MDIPSCPRRGMWMGSLVGLVISVAGTGQAQETPQRPIVDVRIEGNDRVPTEQILSLLRSRVGRSFDQRAVDADVRRLERTRQFYDVVAAVRPAPGGVVLVFKVLERPLLEKLVIRGNRHISTRELTSGLAVGEGQPQSVAANQYARRHILDLYRQNGYPFAKVTLVSGAREGDTTVVFDIVEGPRVRVEEVRLAGNITFSDDELEGQISTEPPFLGLFGGWYNRETVETDLDLLRRFYRRRGFMNVRVERQETYNDDRSEVTLTYVIDEGEAFSVAEVQFLGAMVFAPEELQDGLQLEPGMRFDTERMDADRQEIGRRYGQKGYIEARIQARTRYTQRPNEVVVVYSIQEGERFRLRKVEIVGNIGTKDKVIRRRVVMEPGEWFDLTQMERSRRLLRDSGIFRPFRFVPFTGPPEELPEAPPGAEVTDEGYREPLPHLAIEDAGPGWKDLVVEVEEAETGMFSAGVGVTSDDGVIGSFQITQRNFDIARFPRSWDDIFSGRAWHGAGQRFQMTLQPGTEVNRFDVDFVEPYLFDQPLSLTVSGFFFDRDRDFWDERRLGTRVVFTRELTDVWSAGVGGSFQVVTVESVASDAPEDAFDAEGDNVLFSVPLSLVYDNRDSRLFPTQGTLLRFEAEPFMGDWNFLLLQAQGRQYWRVRSRPDGTRPHVIMAKGSLGYLAGDSPIFQRFYAGGSRSLRGFEFRGAGPHVAGEPVGGDWLMLSTVEYQYPILERQLRGVLFVDAGTVSEDVSASDFRASVGFGFRIMLDVFGGMPIALDFGFPVSSQEDDEEQVFHFSVGTTF